jgi:hypothetical protein
LLAIGCDGGGDARDLQPSGKADDGAPCCEPSAEPGVGENPFCFEGATCCADGTWQCNGGAGQSTCEAPGELCEAEAPCCEPSAEPGVGENPFCFEGATCCADGTWQCNEGAGQSTCEAPGDVCEADPAAS